MPREKSAPCKEVFEGRSSKAATIYIAPGRELKHLATNQLDGPTLASMAISGGSLFIRSATHLYRISN